jgi:predicted transcriptional regulator
MKISTTKAAKSLGISPIALSRYIASGKIPAPEIVELGKRSIHLWTQEDIENARKLLPKIANGRKTRYSKLREKQKPQPGAAVPRKQRSPNKKRTTKPPKAHG